MRKVDGGKIRIAVKNILVFLLSLPGAVFIFNIFSQSMITTTSGADWCNEPFQYFGNRYMLEYGYQHFNHFVVDYMKHWEYHVCEDGGYDTTYTEFYNKYPGMRDEYLGDLVEAILDPQTKNFNRIQTLSLVEKITVNDFSGEKGLDIEYDDLTPFTQKGTQNVAAWWTDRLQQKADETKASIARKREYAIANLRENRKEYKKPEQTSAKKEPSE